MCKLKYCSSQNAIIFVLVLLAVFWNSKIAISLYQKIFIPL